MTIDSDEIISQRILAKHFPNISKLNFRNISGGTFNRSYIAMVDDAPEFIIRISPEKHNLMYFEQLAMSNEGLAYKLMQEYKVPVADFFELGVIDGEEYSIGQFIPGKVLSEQLWSDESKNDAINSNLLENLGKIIKRMHSQKVNTDYCGYLFCVEDKSFTSWAEFLIYSVKNVLENAGPELKSNVKLDELINAFEVNREILDSREKNSIIHGDLWAANVIFNDNGIHLIDLDRTMIGDSLFEFAAGWMDREEFWQGYGSTKNLESLSGNELLCLQLYNIYMNLLHAISNENQFKDLKTARDYMDSINKRLVELV